MFLMYNRLEGIVIIYKFYLVSPKLHPLRQNLITRKYQHFNLSQPYIVKQHKERSHAGQVPLWWVCQLLFHTTVSGPLVPMSYILQGVLNN